LYNLVFIDDAIPLRIEDVIVPCIWNNGVADTTQSQVSSRKGCAVSYFLDELEVAELVDERCDRAYVLRRVWIMSGESLKGLRKRKYLDKFGRCD